MSVPAVSHSPVQPVDDSALKRRKLQEEVDQKEQYAEPASLPFDPGAVCGSISLDLIDGSTPARAADQVSFNFPGIFFAFSDLRKTELMKIIRDHIGASHYPPAQINGIERAILILYSTSLVNSTYGVSAKTLEAELPNYLRLSEPQYAAGWAKHAERALSVPPQSTIEGIQKQLIETGQITAEINQVLNLYFYLDPDNKDRIENIYTYSNRFPTCARLFPRLCQNLSICLQQQGQLVQLRSQLLQLTQALQQQAAALAKGQVQRLPEDREKFLEHQAVLAWDSGADLLDRGLKTLLLEKRKDFRRVFIPDDFAGAITQASRIYEFRAYTFNNLIYNRIDNFPPRFVSEVWGHYLGRHSKITDIADFMRQVIARLPEQMFKQMITDLNTSENKKETVLKTLYQYFATQFRGSVTPIALKHWLK